MRGPLMLRCLCRQSCASVFSRRSVSESRVMAVFFFQAEDGIRDLTVTGVQTCALPIFGGGLAGLAAGVALADSGWRVRLFEQRPFLGGRATSYVLPDGEHVDNCQHVTLGCCTNLEDRKSVV